ncbi:hypothetical protein AMTRI_Chr07g80340 [Amborella trichopoda]|uniref:actin-related protein 9 isoform X1 n=1 Tax=Amborella trichopoda TaxID=13333 RepID=UPI0005D3B83B|nr:actin-related protein 9 isoform X1 [Amborella trichopoda]XP_020526105.1 actin-related protein 9 isoform X1 [Amborella trichopoda]|eukprot:XP_011624659.1 actin-related protein 9 isoform X1 [Amborella trichopoda]
MDYLKSVVPSQLIAERGSNLVVINPGSANVRMGFAYQQNPFSIPHYIAWHVRGGSSDGNQEQKMTVQDQKLVSPITPAQQVEREKGYDSIAAELKIPFLDEESRNAFVHRKVGRVDGLSSHGNRSETTFTWTNVLEATPTSSLSTESVVAKHEDKDQPEVNRSVGSTLNQYKFKDFICGEEALRIASVEPYCLRRPIRRGHFNISQHYSVQQVCEDLSTIWDWVLKEKLHIFPAERYKFSVILVVPDAFDNREIKETLSIVLQDLRFGSAVVHQEGLAAAFGNGLSTACVVNMGAQVTSVICIEDGVALPNTGVTLPFGGEDISRCLLWVQEHHQTWPPVHTDLVARPVDLLMLNKLKESYCQIHEGELDAVAIVHSYENGLGAEAHKMRLTSLNVPPMGLFHPLVLVADECPPPPRPFFHDYDDMLEDPFHGEFYRRPDMPDGLFYTGNGYAAMWDSYPVRPIVLKKEENLGLAEAITRSILSTGRIDLQRKLFCSIQLIGGVASTGGLVAAVEERVLRAIPANEAIDTVEVLQSRGDPVSVSWKGGAILGVLDLVRDAWIQREDWIQSGIHVGSGRKYRDSYYLQAQAMWYINS